MSSVIGNVLKVSLFGESHGKCVGLTINNFPSGIKIPFDSIKEDLLKRKSKIEISTPRKEDDEVIFLSGVFEGYTTGAPITFILENKNFKSSDYIKGVIRPSHADLVGCQKYNGFNDYRGGGHFSGRLTAAIVVLGSLCIALLSKYNILIATHIAQIGDIVDDSLSGELLLNRDNFNQDSFPVINEEVKEKMLSIIKCAKVDKDSIGGKLETVVLNLPKGVGQPYFMGLDAYVSSLLFSLGGVKGVFFGDENCFRKRGSQYNDQLEINEGNINYITNNAGGVLGGISTGEPFIIHTSIKPTPSIEKKQKSINLSTYENIDLEISGRHDPCIVHRLIMPVEALVAFAIVDLMMLDKANRW